MTSRKLLTPLLLIVGFFVSTSPVFSQAKNLKKIHVGVPAVSMGNIIIFFAKETKLYEKHGLDAEVVVMQGSGIASRALVAGSVAISPIATPSVMNAVLAGSDMVILGHTMPGVVQSLVVRPDIKKTEDLKGKIIGVTTFGSLTDFLVRHLAKLKGLNPDKDFTLLQIGGDADRLVALKQGKIPAATLGHPAFVLARREGFALLWDFFKDDARPDSAGSGSGDALHASASRRHCPFQTRARGCKDGR
jgi:NitT/TauT family transport system substrate-binding protein